MERFVTPKTVRVPLSDGDYIDVKRRLTVGEQQDMFALMAPHMNAGEKVQLNTREVQTGKVLAYLVAWSFIRQGVPVPMSPELPEATRLSTLRDLDPDSFLELREAIEAHEDAVEKEIADSKNVPAGLPESVAT